MTGGFCRGDFSGGIFVVGFFPGDFVGGILSWNHEHVPNMWSGYNFIYCNSGYGLGIGHVPSI